MLLEGIGDEEQFVFEPEGTGVGDALDEEVARILEGRQALGIGPGRRSVAGAGGAAVEILVRPFVVVEGAEVIEGPLLGREICARRPTGASLEVRCMRSCAPFSCGEAGRMR